MLCNHVGEPFQYHVPRSFLIYVGVLESFYSYAYHYNKYMIVILDRHPIIVGVDTLLNFQHIMYLV